MSSPAKKRLSSRHGAGLIALLLAVAAPSIGAAQGAQISAPAIRGEVLVVLAKEAPGTIDPELAQLSALRRPPFNGFRTMEILERPTLELRPHVDAEVDLPNGRSLRITLLRVTRDGRYQVRVSINRPREHDYLPLLTVVTSPGDPFFVAGQGHDGGTLIIGIRLGSPQASLAPRPDLAPAALATRRAALFVGRPRPEHATLRWALRRR